MAYDGITVAAVAEECRSALLGSYLSRITQPETDALLLTFKTASGQKRLFLSAQASLPLVYLTDQNRPGPAEAPAFCMLLRKYIGGGKLIEIRQHALERVLCFTFSHRDELGDPRTWHLIAEIMGKHSNVILTDASHQIMDAIKRIPASLSSVREVLPGRTWFIPNPAKKQDPFAATQQSMQESLSSRSRAAAKALSDTYSGFSRVMGEEICVRAGLDGDADTASLSSASYASLFTAMQSVLDAVRFARFAPTEILQNGKPMEFAAVPLSQFSTLEQRSFSSISDLVIHYYAEKEIQTRIRQKSASLRQQVQTLLERCSRTLHLQEKQWKDTEKREQYKHYGELLHTYGYDAPQGASAFTVTDYYTNEPLTIPLDPLLSAQQNAEKYYARYNKMKRTAADLETRLQETRADLAYLESVMTSLENASTEADLSEIRRELSAGGYIRLPHAKKKEKAVVSAPLHYRSADGFDIYVGKNNLQNEQVSFQIASPEDWFFHAKKIPGSHVILKTNGKTVPDAAFEEAARLAAYYSRGKLAPKVEIDYTLKKNLRKPANARPGFVVYYTNYSMMAEPDITGIPLVES